MSAISLLILGNFNPRPPWGGRRRRLHICQPFFLFQSTPSVGRATPAAILLPRNAIISIHALRGEGDRFDFFAVVQTFISIHALRGEGDISPPVLTNLSSNFNPRPPWGGRRRPLFKLPPDFLFQSTPSVGRATVVELPEVLTEKFQSTPSVGRATILSANHERSESIFQSTPSVGRATLYSCVFLCIGVLFQSTPSVGRATLILGSAQTSKIIFQSTPSVGRATAKNFY